MKSRKVQDLKHGLYKLYWKSGEYSLAAVGSLRNGDRWFACTNWIDESKHFGKAWKSVKKATLLIKD